LILYEVLAGRRVFAGLNIFQIAFQAETGRRPAIPDGIHPSLQETIRRSWAIEPHQRPTMSEILAVFEQSNYPFYDDVDVAAVKKFVSDVKRNEPPPPP
jgi:hypothetical protein